jgi:hypothetical protein
MEETNEELTGLAGLAQAGLAQQVTKVKRTSQHSRTLRDICDDVRVSPNRRLLACLVGLQLDAEPGFQKNLYAAILLGEFVSRAGLRLYDADDKRTSPDPKTKLEMEADGKIRDVFQAALNIDFSSLKEGLNEQFEGILNDS